MSALRNIVKQELAKLADCFDCGEKSCQLDTKYPHFIDYLNGLYLTEHRQDCWPPASTFVAPFLELSAFHNGGHK